MKIFLIVFLFSMQSYAFKLHYFGETHVSHATRFKKTTIGGLSALVYHNKSLWSVSDDKGTVNEPRFYEFDLKITRDHISLTPKAVHFLRGFPSIRGEKTIIDAEGMVLLPNGNFLISSEGNTDKKPRIMSRLFEVKADGQFVRDWSIPDKFLPEALGQQTKGLQNNAAFEGLTISENSKSVFAISELPIVTDLVSKDQDATPESVVRILKYEPNAEGTAYVPQIEYAYVIGSAKKQDAAPEVFRGVSEILSINEHQFLVLERGVRLMTTGWKQTVSLYLVDLSQAVDVSKVKNLADSKAPSVQKTLLVDFETDLSKYRKAKPVQNFEGMSWGPTLPDGRKSLLIISDNNFSKKEKTELLVFAVENE